MDKIFINGKEFPSGDLPKSYGEEPKRNFDDNTPKMLIVDDVVDDKGKKLKISKKDIKSYQKLLKMRLRENK